MIASEGVPQSFDSCCAFALPALSGPVSGGRPQCGSTGHDGDQHGHHRQQRLFEDAERARTADISVCIHAPVLPDQNRRIGTAAAVLVVPGLEQLRPW